MKSNTNASPIAPAANTRNVGRPVRRHVITANIAAVPAPAFASVNTSAR